MGQQLQLQFNPLAWELPYAAAAALKTQNKIKEQEKVMYAKQIENEKQNNNKNRIPDSSQLSLTELPRMEPICPCSHPSHCSQVLNPLCHSGNSLCLSLYYFFMIFIFSIMVGLQWSVSFYCTAKWPSHTHIYILVLTLSSIMFHHKWLGIVSSL